MKYYSIIAYGGANPSNVRPSFCHSTLVHAPTFFSPVYAYNCVLEEDENASGTLSFSISRENPSSPYIKAGTIVEVREADFEPKADYLSEYLQNCGKTIWIGRIINLTIDMYGNKSCTCEGMLGFLKDIFVIKYGAMYSDRTLANALSLLISTVAYSDTTELVSDGSILSSQYSYPECLRVRQVVCDSNIAIMSGYISYMTDYFEASGYSPYINYQYKGNSMSVFDFLNDVFGGFGQASAEGYPYNDEYLYMRMEIIHPEEEPSLDTYVNEPRMVGLRLIIGVDAPSKFGYPTGNNRLVFGESITAASISYDFTNTFTTIRFLGGETTTPYGSKTTLSVNSDNSTNPPKTVINGVLDSTNGAIQEWGIIPGIIDKSDIKSEAQLMLYANMYRNIAANPVSSFTASGIDLSFKYSYLTAIILGKYYEVRFPGQDFDNNVIGETDFMYRCIGRKINILNPGKNEYKFSRIIGVMNNGVSSINSRMQTQMLNQVKKENQELKARVDELSKDLEESKKQIQSATNMLKMNGVATSEETNTAKEEENQNGENN